MKFVNIFFELEFLFKREPNFARYGISLLKKNLPHLLIEPVDIVC